MSALPRARAQTLRTRLVVVVGLLLASFEVAFFVYFAVRMDGQARLLVERRAVGIASVLSGATEAALDFDDPLTAEEQLASLERSQTAVYAVLLRPDGSVFAGWHAERRQVASETALHSGSSIHSGNVDVRVPIHTRLGHDATLVARFSLADLESEEREALRSALVVSALMLAIGALAAFAAGTLLVRPLRRVTDIAHRITEGDLSAQQQLDLTRGDETGELAVALDSMLRRLHEQRALVAAANLELEARVAGRTRELGLANEELGKRLGQLQLAQEQLVVADRRTSIGLLAAGVAHEINNPLSYVASNLGFVSEELARLGVGALEGGAEVVEALKEAGEGSRRIRHIVQSLKSFSRGDDSPPAPVELHGALDSALNIAGAEIRHRATLVKDYQGAPLVFANEVRLGQVFLNLLINAAQAIEPGATEHNEIRVSVRTAENGWAQVDISDTGSGIPPEVRSRLFTPFFTTKPVGQGTGLGLSVCQGIISAAGGTIGIESEVGRGTTFTVLLPPSQELPQEKPAPQARAASPHRARLLVVDDDPLVGKAIKRQLEREHEVVLSPSGRDALARLDHGEGFDLILCDLMMPNMSGTEFYAEVCRKHRKLEDAVAFISGGAFTDATRAFAKLHADRLIAKPIDFSQLRRRIDERVRARLAERPQS